MKILITGCAGFIGANFSNYILDTYSDDEVVGIDSLTYAANEAALEALLSRERFSFYHADICDSLAIDVIFSREKPDIVVNFAAESHVDRSIADAHVFVETNVVGVQTLLDACLSYGVRRFHQVSTDEVYGDLPLGSAEVFGERSPLFPSSPYSASKASADLLTLAYHRTHGLPVSISRSSNNFGAYQHREKLIPCVIDNVLRKNAVSVYGDGKNERDWLYVLDNCRAIDMIMRKGRIGEIYNVASGNVIDNLSLVKYILSLLDKPESLISFVPDRKGHDRKYALDCSKIKKELGWEPSVRFEEALKSTLKHYT